MFQMRTYETFDAAACPICHPTCNRQDCSAEYSAKSGYSVALIANDCVSMVHPRKTIDAAQLLLRIEEIELQLSAARSRQELQQSSFVEIKESRQEDRLSSSASVSPSKAAVAALDAGMQTRNSMDNQLTPRVASTCKTVGVQMDDIERPTITSTPDASHVDRLHLAFWSAINAHEQLYETYTSFATECMNRHQHLITGVQDLERSVEAGSTRMHHEPPPDTNVLIVLRERMRSLTDYADDIFTLFEQQCLSVFLDSSVRCYEIRVQTNTKYVSPEITPSTPPRDLLSTDSAAAAETAVQSRLLEAGLTERMSWHLDRIERNFEEFLCRMSTVTHDAVTTQQEYAVSNRRRLEVTERDSKIEARKDERLQTEDDSHSETIEVAADDFMNPASETPLKTKVAPLVYDSDAYDALIATFALNLENTQKLFLLYIQHISVAFSESMEKIVTVVETPLHFPDVQPQLVQRPIECAYRPPPLVESLDRSTDSPVPRRVTPLPHRSSNSTVVSSRTSSAQRHKTKRSQLVLPPWNGSTSLARAVETSARPSTQKRSLSYAQSYQSSKSLRVHSTDSLTRPTCSFLEGSSLRYQHRYVEEQSGGCAHARHCEDNWCDELNLR